MKNYIYKYIAIAKTYEIMYNINKINGFIVWIQCTFSNKFKENNDVEKIQT